MRKGKILSEIDSRNGPIKLAYFVTRSNLLYPIDFKLYLLRYERFKHLQSNNEVVTLGRSIFEQTVDSYR